MNLPDTLSPHYWRGFLRRRLAVRNLDFYMKAHDRAKAKWRREIDQAMMQFERTTAAAILGPDPEDTADARRFPAFIIMMNSRREADSRWRRARSRINLRYDNRSAWIDRIFG